MTTDKKLVKERFEANFRRYDRLALVQQRICAQLARRAGEWCRVPVKRALEIGAGTGFLTGRLLDQHPGAEWWLNDIAPAAEKYLAKYAQGIRHEYLWGDAESVEFPEGLDMIASASTVQWFDDMRGFARKAARALNTGGWLILSTFGPENFREIKAAAGEGLDYYTAGELSVILDQGGYEVLSVEEYTESLRFDTPTDVLHHIRATGVNLVSKVQWTRGRLTRFSEDYRALFPDPAQGVPLTYHPILIVARKR